MADRPTSSRPAGPANRNSPLTGSPVTLRGIIDQLKPESGALFTAAASHLQRPVATLPAIFQALHTLAGSPAAFAALQLETSDLDLPTRLLKACICMLAADSQLDASGVAVAVGVVARLSNFLADKPTTPRNVAAGGSMALRRTAEQDIRTYALVTLALLPAKHADLLLPHWPTLFPNVDATKCGNRHPVLTPLVYDACFRTRASAAAAVTQILQKSHTQLQFATEARQAGQSASSSNTTRAATPSAASTAAAGAPAASTAAAATSAAASYPSSSSGISGAVLRQLHDVLYYALTAKECQSSRGLSFAALAPVVIATPYKTCPGSLQVLGKCLMLPALLELLSKRETHDVTSALLFLGAVLRAKPLADLLAKFLKGAASEPLTDAAIKTLPALEGWKQCIHFARSAPWVIGKHFEFVYGHAIGHITAAAAAAPVTVVAGKQQQGQQGTQQQQDKDRAVEAVRCLLHFYGFAWESFDSAAAADLQPVGGNSSSSSSTSSNQPVASSAQDPPAAPASASGHTPQGRATPEQKKLLFETCFVAAAAATGSLELRCMAYKALGQLGDDFLGGGAGQTASAAAARRDRVVQLLVAQGGAESDAGAKAEVLGSVGVLAWKAPSMDVYHGQFVALGVRLLQDPDPVVRAKAGFVLSNIAGRVCATLTPTVCVEAAPATPTAAPAARAHVDPTATTKNTGDNAEKAGGPTSVPPAATTAAAAAERDAEQRRATAEGLIFALCEASALAVQDSDASVVGHGVRVMCFLLRVLSDMDLIMVVGDYEDGYANFCLTTFKALLTSVRDAKLRWNAAYAVGEVLSRPEVVQSDPPAAADCVKAILHAVRTDHFFKVRSLAAAAIAKVHMPTLKASGYDLDAQAFDDVCHALAACSDTQSYAQYKEADALRRDLLDVIKGRLERSPGTPEFQRVLVIHKQLLTSHKLM